MKNLKESFTKEFDADFTNAGGFLMTNKLKQYFPMIRGREEILNEISSREELKKQFESWSQEWQEEFLNFCTGVRGIKLLYDGFFKEIMNPETKPERLNDFLSQALQKKVKIIKVLPADSTRIADESSLIIMDIVVELEEGSIANVEIQKIGYLFPGERSACYSADLLLRQYKRVRSEKKKKFSYRDIKTVYTIVLFEKSPAEFHNFSESYYHNFEQKSDTGMKMELLQKYLFIPLDIFKKIQQNKGINSKLDAWLTLFVTDDPDMIITLLQKYPEFQTIYEEAYDICRNMEEVMAMFSRELYELDKNTVQYMIDEMQETIDNQNEMIDNQKKAIKEMQAVIENSVKNSVSTMRNEKLPEEKILSELQEQYHISEEQAQKYLELYQSKIPQAAI